MRYIRFKGKFERNKRVRARWQLVQTSTRFFRSPAVRFWPGKSVRCIGFKEELEREKRAHARQRIVYKSARFFFSLTCCALLVSEALALYKVE